MSACEELWEGLEARLHASPEQAGGPSPILTLVIGQLEGEDGE